MKLIFQGNLKSYKIVGGSGMDMYYYCPSCSCFIYNKPDLLEGMAYVPAGLLGDQIEFKPTVELWSDKDYVGCKSSLHNPGFQR